MPGLTLQEFFSFKRPPRAIAALDGWRGMAALMVFTGHTMFSFWEPGIKILPVSGWDAWNPAMNIWFCVEMFFILSGFLIFKHLIQTMETPGHTGRELLRYARNRAVRILPAYYFMVFLIASGAAAAFYTPASKDISHSLLTHLLVLQDYTGSDISETFWAVGVEVKFYILAPVAVMLLWRTGLMRYRYILLGALFFLPTLARALTPISLEDFVIVFGDKTNFFRTPFHLYFDPFIIGGICAALYQDRKTLDWLENPKTARILFWTGLLILIPILAQTPAVAVVKDGAIIRQGLNQVYLQTAVNVALGLIFMALLLGYGPMRFLESAPLRVMAYISYSFYLVHMLMLYLAHKILVKIYPPLTALHFDMHPLGLQWVSLLALGFILSFTAAMVLHFLIERPFILLRGKSRPGPDGSRK